MKTFVNSSLTWIQQYSCEVLNPTGYDTIVLWNNTAATYINLKFDTEVWEREREIVLLLTFMQTFDIGLSFFEGTSLIMHGYYY